MGDWSEMPERRSAPERSWGRNPLEVIAYLAVAPLLRGLARLPLSALYRVSDLASWVMYRVLRYRREVVRENLRRSFPEAAPEELARLAEQSYRNVCDVAFESVKLMAMSEAEIRERVSVDLGIARELYERRQSAVFVLGHCGNWEWAIPIAVLAFTDVVIHVIYHPLRHPGFEGLVHSVRSRFGGTFTPIGRAGRAIIRLRRKLTATFLVADQRARGSDSYFTIFLGQKTAFLRGPEQLARSLDVPVVYAEVRRVERGRYDVSLEWLCEYPNGTSDGEITERFARRLEQQIRKDPADWLWLHRRWRDRRAERAEVD
jgi:Kdo2-lipid IVA lauroyltransferase/acyltransferase